jgi:hypothetical protein
LDKAWYLLVEQTVDKGQLLSVSVLEAGGWRVTFIMLLLLVDAVRVVLLATRKKGADVF